MERPLVTGDRLHEPPINPRLRPDHHDLTRGRVLIWFARAVSRPVDSCDRVEALPRLDRLNA